MQFKNLLENENLLFFILYFIRFKLVLVNYDLEIRLQEMFLK